MSQSIANRLGEVEDRLRFLMTSMRMRAVMTSGVVGSDGKPVGKVLEGSMEELYQMQRAIPVVTQDMGEPPQLSEDGNGDEQ